MELRRRILLDGTFEGVNVLYRLDLGGGNFSTLKDFTDPTFLNFLETFDTPEPVHDSDYGESEGQSVLTLVAQLTNKRLDTGTLVSVNSISFTLPSLGLHQNYALELKMSRGRHNGP
jgi:hypothetical protein